MSLPHHPAGARPRRLLSATAAGLLAATGIAVPAAAEDFPECDGLAADAADYEGELACASELTEGEASITLTASFEVPAWAENVFYGTQPLTIEAAPGVVITGARAVGGDSLLEGTFLTTASEDSEFGFPGLGEIEAPEQDVEPAAEAMGGDVTVTGVDLRRFRQAGAIMHLSSGTLTLDAVAVRNSSNAAAEEIGFPLFGGAVTAWSALTVTGSTFGGNEGFFGGAIAAIDPALFFGGPEGLESADLNSLAVTDTVFRGNAAEIGGAMIAFGNLTVAGARFIENQAASGGGALAAIGTDVSVSGSQFVGNAVGGDAQFESGPGGGALLLDGAATISESLFRDNASNSDGGAIVAFDEEEGFEGTAVDITDARFVGNSADGDGAAIYAEQPLTLNRVTVREHASATGAVVAQRGASVTDSLLRLNSSEDGAALDVRGALEVSGTSFVRNAAEWGPAAIRVETDPSGAVAIVNSTFAANASERTGAVYVDNEGSVDVTLAQSTFWRNSTSRDGTSSALTTSGDGAYTLTANAFADRPRFDACSFGSGDGVTVSTAHTFDADGSCTSGWSGEGDFGDGLDPMLEGLDATAGPTPVVLPAEASPLLDVVPASALVSMVDQRGIARPQGDAADVGAVEVEVVAPEPEPEPEPEPAPAGPEAGDVTFQVATPGGTILGLATPALSVSDVAWVDVADLPAPPAGTALPFGAAAFTVQVPEPGAEVTITLTAPRPFTDAFKVSNGAWTEIDGAEFSADRLSVTYTLIDGGALDEDGEANGEIVDPVALAVQATFTG